MAEEQQAVSVCEFSPLESYDIGFRIGALFILLGVSFLGTLIPLASRKVLNDRLYRNLLVILKLFGAGVLVSTALIHMLVPAILLSASPCLPQGLSVYASWPGAMVLFGLLVSNLLQLVITSVGRNQETAEKEQMLALEQVADAFDCHDHKLVFKSQEKTSVYLLEVGVAVHSIIIGLSLGTVGGDEFVPLLIALSFHQLFEGMAVSALVAEHFYQDKLTTFAMTALYVLSTPLGVALGIIIRESYNGNAASTLIVQIVLESFAAGLVIYEALSSIIVPFFRSENYFGHSLLVKLFAVISLWLGSLVMAIVGIWA